jgi:carboxylesterase type B
VTDDVAGVSRPLLFLDADVLYPIRICDFILTAASLGMLHRPIVSDAILDEASRNIVADRSDLSASQLKRRFDAVRRSTDGHGMAVSRRFHDDALINKKDRHVVAAGRLHEVDVIVSNDKRLRREVNKWAAEHRSPLRACSADELASELREANAARVVEVIAAMAARMTNPPRSADEVLSAMTVSLPSLAGLASPG